MASKTSLSRKAVLAQFLLINLPSFFPLQMRQNFLLLLLDKALVMETAHISSFPSHNCGSEVLPNVNCIPSEEGGKKPKQTNQPTKNYPQTLKSFCLIHFALWLHCRNKTISQSRSFNFPHQLPLKSSTLRKIWWGALRTVSNLSAHIHIQIHRKSNTRFTSREKTINLPELWEFPSRLLQVEIVHAS